MFTKPASQLTSDDLNLVLGVAETERLEFKRDVYGRADEDIREFLKDISSMANAGGGFLLIGVGADAEERATTFLGLENAGDEAGRMLSSCRANLEEQILGLDFGLIEVEEGRHVIVWGIPRSTRAPHMITFKGLNQFWRRQGRQKAKMTIEEIREACIRVENLSRNLESFVRERHVAILERLGGRLTMMLSATPVVVRGEVLDIGDAALRAILTDPPRSRANGFRPANGTPPRASLHGLRVEVGNDSVELFRNGHLECVQTLADDEADQRRLNVWQIGELPLNFLFLMRAVAERVGLQEPIIVSVTLTNVRGWHLRANALAEVAWVDADDLELPPMQFSYPLDPNLAAKRIADRIWNSFHLDSCPMFDEQGGFDAERIRALGRAR